MEENIKRVEHLIERCNQCKSNACITCDICWSEVQAIENLLKGYKELEEENKKYPIKLNDETYRKVIENAQKDYIPISVIQNKMDELEEEKQCFYSDYSIEERNNKIQILQELLGERNK